jgi:long-chain acyl-CoA synthetase
MAAVSTNKPGYFGVGSVELDTDKPAGDGSARTRRLAISSDKLVERPFEGIDTVADVIAYAARTHGAKQALGWRDVVNIHEEQKEVTKNVGGKEVKETKTWKYFELSDYKYISYLDVQAAVSEVARALVDLEVSADDVFNVYAATR